MMLYGKLSAVLRRFYEPPLCSHAYAIQRPPRRGGAPTLKRSWPVAPADVFGDEVVERKHGTAGRRTPAYTLHSRR
jgi:hypothetical protein